MIYSLDYLPIFPVLIAFACEIFPEEIYITLYYRYEPAKITNLIIKLIGWFD